MGTEEIEWVWSLCSGRHQCSVYPYTYTILCYHVQSGSGSVSVYTNPISPSIVVAFLRLRREFSEYGRCAQGALCFSQCIIRASTLYVLVIRVYV